MYPFLFWSTRTVAIYNALWCFLNWACFSLHRKMHSKQSSLGLLFLNAKIAIIWFWVCVLNALLALTNIYICFINDVSKQERGNETQTETGNPSLVNNIKVEPQAVERIGLGFPLGKEKSVSCSDHFIPLGSSVDGCLDLVGTWPLGEACLQAFWILFP